MTTRQRAWQLRMVEEGRCSICGDKAKRKGYCELHYKVKLERVRDYRERKREEQGTTKG